METLKPINKLTKKQLTDAVIRAEFAWEIVRDLLAKMNANNTEYTIATILAVLDGATKEIEE